MKKTAFYIIFIFLIFESCTPICRITIINKTNYPARIKIINKDSDIKDNIWIINAKSNISITNRPALCTKQFIREYISFIKRIDIITHSDSISLISEQEMYTYLKKRVTGVFNNGITIKLK